MKQLFTAARNRHVASQSRAWSGRVVGLVAAILSVWPPQVVPADLALQTLYEFKSNPKNPRSDLVQGSDGNFYGTTWFGGTNGENGTVFQLTPGGAFNVLH